MDKQTEDILTFIEKAIECKLAYTNEIYPERNEQMQGAIEAYRDIRIYIKARCG